MMPEAASPVHEPAYVTCIPPEAEERVTEAYPDGARQKADYWLEGHRVGFRSFHPTGEPDYEVPYRDGVVHGTRYRWDEPGKLLSAEPYERGVPHGTARQWGDDGRLIGTYTLERGTGIDLWWQDWPDASAYLAEVHYMQDGWAHGFEWWLNEDQQSVWIERHWLHGNQHGIERDWNARGRLSRGYPRYWVNGERVTKRQYLKAAARDPSLPPFRPEENEPERTFPPEIAGHLRRK
jgi:hypothetical protein